MNSRLNKCDKSEDFCGCMKSLNLSFIIIEKVEVFQHKTITDDVSLITLLA